MTEPNPQSPASRSDHGDAASWATVNAENSDMEEFKVKMYSEMKKMCEDFGGPAQFLQSLAVGDKQSFMEHLWESFPERDDLLYSREDRLPTCQEKDLGQQLPVIVHVSALGFSPDCSLKPMPGSELCLQLAEQYLADGFCTAGEPLFVAHPLSAGIPAPWAGERAGPCLSAFSLGYIKGMARATTLLAMLCKAWQLGIAVSVHETLFQSCRAVYVHHLLKDSKMDEALANMKFSARGAIRKRANVIQIAVMVSNLYKHGLTDFGVFVRKWNAMSARADHIVGKRAMALKFLFEMVPKDCLPCVPCNAFLAQCNVGELIVCWQLRFLLLPCAATTMCFPGLPKCVFLGLIM